MLKGRVDLRINNMGKLDDCDKYFTTLKGEYLKLMIHYNKWYSNFMHKLHVPYVYAFKMIMDDTNV